MWIYLHKNRTVEFPVWNEHLLKKTEQKINIELDLNSNVKIIDADTSKNFAEFAIKNDDAVSSFNNSEIVLGDKLNSSGQKAKKGRMLKQKRKHP